MVLRSHERYHPRFNGTPTRAHSPQELMMPTRRPGRALLAATTVLLLTSACGLSAGNQDRLERQLGTTAGSGSWWPGGRPCPCRVRAPPPSHQARCCRGRWWVCPAHPPDPSSRARRPDPRPLPREGWSCQARRPRTPRCSPARTTRWASVRARSCSAYTRRSPTARRSTPTGRCPRRLASRSTVSVLAIGSPIRTASRRARCSSSRTNCAEECKASASAAASPADRFGWHIRMRYSQVHLEP